MNFEDRFSIPKPAKGAKRGLVTEKQAQASLDRGRAGCSKFYGFALDAADTRCAVRATRREGGEAFVIYGANGRRLDAGQLAYELNN